MASSPNPFVGVMDRSMTTLSLKEMDSHHLAEVT
jgi:hypothetical protein